jgi:hypothetical protein
VKVSAALLVLAAASGPQIVSAAPLADPPRMKVDVPDEVCVMAPKPGFAQCAPSATDPSPAQMQRLSAAGELLFFAKTTTGACVIVIVRTQGFTTPSDLRAYDRGLRDEAEAQGQKLLQLKTSKTKVGGGVSAVQSAIDAEARGAVVHSRVYLVEAGDATYTFNFSATNADVMDAVARTTMGTFNGAKSKRPLLTPYKAGYYGGWLVVLVVIVAGCIYAARKRPHAPPPPWPR